MSAERVEQANRVDIVAAKRITRKGFLWTPGIAYLRVWMPFLYPIDRDQGRGNPRARVCAALYASNRKPPEKLLDSTGAVPVYEPFIAFLLLIGFLLSLFLHHPGR
jgi:hypothetical protein